MPTAAVIDSPATRRPAPGADRPLLASLRRLTLLGLVGMALVTLGTFGARLAWPLELLTHFRPQYVLILTGLLGLALMLRCYRAAGLTALLLVVHLVALRPDWSAPERLAAQSGKDLRVYYANVHTHNRGVQSVVEQIGRERPDLVILLEADSRWLSGLEAIRERFPHRIGRPRPDNFGVVVYAREPFVAAEVFALVDEINVPAVAVRIELDGDEVELLAVHTIPPVGGRRRMQRDVQMRALAAFVQRVEAPVVVIGDLNCTPWSPAFSDLLEATGLRDSRAGFGVQATWPSRLGVFGIPIDHVLVGTGVRVLERRVGDPIGSDHLPIVCDLTLGGAG